MTTMPALSQTKIDVGMVASPGCSKTMRGLRFSPTTSQMALPKARASAAQAPYASLSRQSGGSPQWSKRPRSMYPAAPRLTQNSPRSSPEATATGMPPQARTIWIAWEPSPPLPPHTSTTSFSRTTWGSQPHSMRYAVAPTSMYAAAAAQLSRGGLGSSWCACTSVNCAKLPQLVSYPQMRALGAVIGSPPATMNGSAVSHCPQCTTTSSPTRTLSTPSPTAYTTPEASLPPMWKSSSAPALRRAAMTSTGRPSAAHTLL